MKKKWHWFGFLAIGFSIVAVSFIIKERYNICILYLKLLKQSGTLAHYNKHGQLDGEFTSYIRGQLYVKSYFKNGFREGWCTWYNETTGKRDTEIYYKYGVPGVENVYYANGNLDYTAQWKNGRYINSEYHYLDNGVLNTYNAFDLSKNIDNGYCYIAYDNAGKFHQILGDVFSSCIYSTCQDSTIALTKNGKYNCLSNLYIKVATPPLLKPTIKLIVNKITFNKLVIRDNTIVVPGVFDVSGKYEVVIYGKLQTTYGAIIKSDTLKTYFYKE